MCLAPVWAYKIPESYLSGLLSVAASLRCLECTVMHSLWSAVVKCSAAARRCIPCGQPGGCCGGRACPEGPHQLNSAPAPAGHSGLSPYQSISTGAAHVCCLLHAHCSCHSPHSALALCIASCGVAGPFFSLAALLQSSVCTAEILHGAFVSVTYLVYLRKGQTDPM